MRNLILYSVLMAMLIGCAPAHVRLQPGQDYTFTVEKMDGIVFFSTSYSGDCAPSGTVQLRAEPLTVEKPSWKGGLEDNLFITANPFLKSDYADHYAIFHSRAWPAGGYRFFDLSFTSFLEPPINLVTEFDIPFRVTPNKASYLGRINIEFRCDESATSPHPISIHDDSRYDIPSFKQRNAKISESDIIVEVMKINK